MAEGFLISLLSLFCIIKVTLELAAMTFTAAITDIWCGYYPPACFERKVLTDFVTCYIMAAAADSAPLNSARRAYISEMRTILHFAAGIERTYAMRGSVITDLLGYGRWILADLAGDLLKCATFVETDLDRSTIIESKMFSF